MTPFVGRITADPAMNIMDVEIGRSCLGCRAGSASTLVVLRAVPATIPDQKPGVSIAMAAPVADFQGHSPILRAMRGCFPRLRSL